jgi:hypothetical protein
VWFVAYHHSLRPDEAGVKFVTSEAETITEKKRLELLGYIVTKIEPTSKARMEDFLAGTLSAPEQPLLS